MGNEIAKKSQYNIDHYNNHMKRYLKRGNQLSLQDSLYWQDDGMKAVEIVFNKSLEITDEFFKAAFGAPGLFSLLAKIASTGEKSQTTDSQIRHVMEEVMLNEASDKLKANIEKYAIFGRVHGDESRENFANGVAKRIQDIEDSLVELKVSITSKRMVDPDIISSFLNGCVVLWKGYHTLESIGKIKENARTNMWREIKGWIRDMKEFHSKVLLDNFEIYKKRVDRSLDDRPDMCDEYYVKDKRCDKSFYVGRDLTEHVVRSSKIMPKIEASKNSLFTGFNRQISKFL